MQEGLGASAAWRCSEWVAFPASTKIRDVAAAAREPGPASRPLRAQLGSLGLSVISSKSSGRCSVKWLARPERSGGK